jgi:SP family general alpha glucoside:H+ symporter-like MFS transporter
MSDASRSIRDPDCPQPARSSNDKAHPSEFLEFITVANPASHRLQPLRVQTSHDLDKHASENQIHITTSNDDLFSGLSRAIPGLRRLSVEARAATKAEHAMTFLRGCRLYPKAMMWSVLLSMTIVMESYDKTLINSFYAFPVFRRSYGTPINPSAAKSQLDYQISPAWQSALTNAALVGEILGLMFNGFLTDRWGIP